MKLSVWFHVITWGATCLAIIAIVWVALLGDRSPSWIWTPTTAAWVQAIGSVLAILAAVWIDRGAARRAERAVERAEEVRYHAGRSAVVFALGVLSSIRTVVDAADGDSARVDVDEPRRWIANARNILDYQTDRDHIDPNLVTTLFASRDAIGPLEIALKGYNGSGGSYYAITGALREAEERIGGLLEELDNERLALKSDEEPWPEPRT